MDILKLFLNNLPYPIWIEDPDTKIIFLNKAYEKMYKINLHEVIGKKNKEVFSPEVSLLYDNQIRNCLESLTYKTLETSLNNTIVECLMFPLTNDDKIQGVAGIIIDITDRKERELEIKNQQNILRTIIDSLPEAIFYKDKESRFIGYNKNFSDFYAKEGVYDLVGKSDIEIFPNKEAAETFVKQDKEVLLTKKPKYSQYSVIEDNGTVRYEENLKVPVINENGQAWGIVGLSRNITERKNLEDKLRYLSYTDSLTGLYNRSSFEEKINELNDPKYLPLGIIMGDVNGLKLVNDTLGHLEGDKLLKSISTVLKDVCLDKGPVFRWGGDEFVILLPNFNEYSCENVISEITEKCNNNKFDFIQLSIALAESVKHSVDDDVYDCIKEVEEKVYRRKLLEKKSIRSTIMDSLKKSLEEKNTETEEHTERVTQHAYAIGLELNFKLAELDELYLVAKLHDIGKIGINEDILSKPGKLTSDEFEIMKTHTEKGYRIIQAAVELENVAKCVLCHHERWDGTGYPLGLSEDQIPLMSRIISVVDSYDVMTHERPYKKPISKELAIEELKKCSGSQFDPTIVDIFIKYLHNYNE